MREKLINEFKNVYGDSADVRVFFAPGRVNLIGEHTDYNGGHVFPCALTVGTYAAVRKREDRVLRLYSMNFEKLGVIETSLDDLNPLKDTDWTAYPKGVIWAFGEKGHKVENGFDLVLYGDIPNGSGLSSSASLEVLTGLILRELNGIDVTNTELALIGQYSENNYNGMNCGIMDQFASAMGKKDNAIFLDTANLEFEYAPLVLENTSIVVTNSKVKHSLVGSDYNTRRKECEAALADLQKVIDIKTLGDLTEEQYEEHKGAIKDATCAIRAKHAVYENVRTVKALEALKAGRIDEFGKLMNASHVSLRDDYDVSCPEIDILVDIAWKVDGVIGSRITGGGFGGCTVSLVKNDSIDTFKESVGSAYKEKTGIDAEFYVVSAGNGPIELTKN